MSIRGLAPRSRNIPAARPGYPVATLPPEAERTPGAVPAGTAVAVFGCLLTALFARGDTASAVARFGAIGFGLSLAGSVLIDFRLGMRNLIRADLLALAAYYFLTFFEFLFPQPSFDLLVSAPVCQTGVATVLTGAVGILIGRHLWKPKTRPLQALLTREIPSGMLLVLFWSALAIGYLHMLLAVRFDVMKMIDAFMGPRFAEPWARGKFGDWKALVFELGLLIYLLPPLGGIMLARRERYSIAVVVPVLAAVAFTFFYGFSGGTRNVFASYLVTFVIGYAFAAGPNRRKELGVIVVTSAVAFVIASQLMLQFRSEGLKNWLDGTTVPPENGIEQSVFIDFNLYAVCRLTETFPKNVPYLGWEIPYAAIIRPIPRALWPGKPEGLTSSIEEALGVQNVTISATFAGEAYMSSGILAVAAVGLVFGAVFGWWNYLASPRNSEMGILIYSSGFFSAVISMRSMLVFTTALLPTLAAILLGTIVVNQAKKLERLRAHLFKRTSLRPVAPPAGKPPR